MKRLVMLSAVFIAALLVLFSGNKEAVQAEVVPGLLDDRLDQAVALYVGSPQALVNHQEVPVDADNAKVVPMIKDDRTLVPVRFISESFGANVGWEKATARVTIALDNRLVKMAIGEKTMEVDGEDVTLDVAAELINDRTYIPLRHLVEALGKEVFYDRGLIVISEWENVLNKESEKDLIDTVIAKVNRLPVVGSYEKFKELLDEWQYTQGYAYGRGAVDAVEESTSTNTKEAQYGAPAQKSKADDYSTTNVQVQGVDEADTVKTDGEFIYRVNKRSVVVAKAYPANELKVVDVLKFEESFSPNELYIDGKYLVVIGQAQMAKGEKDGGEVEPAENTKKMMPPYYGYNYSTRAMIYDITDKANIRQQREVEVEGNYISSRKIGEALYLITDKNIHYYAVADGEENVLPCYRDTAVKDEPMEIDYPEVRYFPEIEQPNYMIITGIDLGNMDEKVKIQTFLGAGRNVYSSMQNLYVAVNSYNQSYHTMIDQNESATKTTIAIKDNNLVNTLIYKFSLNGSQVTFLHKGEVPGTILNQFSMDEHQGHFRIATTSGQGWRGDSNNNLYVLDELMKISGKIENIAPGERIYSVRFMGDRGYMVTFKTVDPLFVIGLEDPKNPKILGALKIPGYSDYLHPYDENHIIGFGKDTVEINGSAYDQGMKIAMFDVSDVNHPIELFKENIGDRGTDSELLRNHKALLFSKEKNLMAFPIAVMKVNESEKVDEKEKVFRYGEFAFQGAYVYTVDLKNGFSIRGKITHLSEEDYLKAGNYYFDPDKHVDRILYIGDNLYTLSNGMIKATGMEDMREKNTLVLP